MMLSAFHSSSTERLSLCSRIPDFGERVELAHEARVEVHRRVQPAVSVHSLDLGAVLGVLEQKVRMKHFGAISILPFDKNIL